MSDDLTTSNVFDWSRMAYDLWGYVRANDFDRLTRRTRTTYERGLNYYLYCIFRKYPCFRFRLQVKTTTQREVAGKEHKQRSVTSEALSTVTAVGRHGVSPKTEPATWSGNVRTKLRTRIFPKSTTKVEVTYGQLQQHELTRTAYNSTTRTYFTRFTNGRNVSRRRARLTKIVNESRLCRRSAFSRRTSVRLSLALFQHARTNPVNETVQVR